jgi:hypothetical protein
MTIYYYIYLSSTPQKVCGERERERKRKKQKPIHLKSMDFKHFRYMIPAGTLPVKFWLGKFKVVNTVTAPMSLGKDNFGFPFSDQEVSWVWVMRTTPAGIGPVSKLFSNCTCFIMEPYDGKRKKKKVFEPNSIEGMCVWDGDCDRMLTFKDFILMSEAISRGIVPARKDINCVKA